MPTTARVKPWRVAIISGLASYLDSGALIASSLAIGTLYTDSMKLSPAVVGAVLGTQTLSLAVGAAVGGRLGDRFGRRRVFTLSMLLLAIGATILALATGPATLFLGVAVIGVAIGADIPVSLAMINETAPEGKKGKMVAFTELLWGAGILVSSVLGSLLATLGVVGGRILFGQLALSALIVLALRVTLPESQEWLTATARIRVAAATPATPEPKARLRLLFRKPVLGVLLATGLYYAAWGVGANTLGQFGAYLWVHQAGGNVSAFALLSLIGVPLAVVAGLIFLRVVDTNRRGPWFAIGSGMLILAWLIPTIVGPTIVSLIAASLLLTISTGFCGETIYKVWSQELLPTLLRGTAQGTTFAFKRVVAGAFAFGTPLLAAHDPVVLFSIVLALAVVASGIGLFWIPRLPRAQAVVAAPEPSTEQAAA